MPISRLDFDFLIRLRRENCAYVCWIFFFGEGFDEIIVILTRSDLVETFDQIMGLTLRYVKGSIVSKARIFWMDGVLWRIACSMNYSNYSIIIK